MSFNGKFKEEQKIKFTKEYVSTNDFGCGSAVDKECVVPMGWTGVIENILECELNGTIIFVRFDQPHPYLEHDWENTLQVMIDDENDRPAELQFRSCVELR